MRRLVYFFLPIVVCLLGMAHAQDPLAQDFSVVLLPDTQNYSQYYPETFDAQTNWIVANRSALNIQFVIGLGDIVNTAEDTTQWQNADAAIKILDAAGVPYALAIGNHDYDQEKPSLRQATMYNTYFGPSRYAAYSYYKEQYPAGSNENFYTTFTAGGKNYLVLALEMHPRDSALDWATSVLASHPDYDVIVVTHSFMYVDGTRVDSCDTHDVGANNGNTPEQMWEKWVSRQQNVIMVVSGHITKKAASRRTDMTSLGTIVNQMLSNYQDWPNGGNGYLRILKFHPATNKVDVLSYSPTLDKYLSDSDNQFTLDLHYAGSPGTGTGAVAGKIRESGTCSVLSGAKVDVAGSTATADANGDFSVTLPAPSLYSVGAEDIGHDSATEDRQVYEGFSTEADFYLTSSASSSTCPAASASPSVNICSPADGSSATSPVHVLATLNSSSSISYNQIYVDGSKVWKGTGTQVDADLPMATGTHRLTVQAKNADGVLFKSTLYVTVGSSTSSGCPAGSTSPSVNICSPSDGSTVSSPVHVLATLNSSSSISYSQIYVDGRKVWNGTGTQVDTSLTMAAGTHRLTVQAKNADGVLFKSTVYVTVSSTTASACPLNSVDPSVTICSPDDHSSSASPIHIVAGDNEFQPGEFHPDLNRRRPALAGLVRHVDAELALLAGTHRVAVPTDFDAGASFRDVACVTVD